MNANVIITHKIHQSLIRQELVILLLSIMCLIITRLITDSIINSQIKLIVNGI